MGHPLSAFRNLALALIGLFAASPAMAQIAPPDVKAALIAQSSRPAPGQSLPLAIAIEPPRGWHIYWQNPGDSGYAPRFSWTLPEGVTISAPRHPVPKRMVIGGIAMNVHEGRTVLVADVAIAAKVPLGTALPLGGTIDLLVCSQESCVPDTVTLSQKLVAGDGAIDPPARSLIMAAQGALPQASDAQARYKLSGQTLTMGLALPAPVPENRLELYPVAPDGGVIGPVRLDRAQDGEVLISAPLGTARADSFKQVMLVERRPDTGVAHAWLVSASPGDPFSVVPDDTAAGMARLIAPVLAPLAAAVLGGLLLNLMPCVFPILSLKAMALVRSGAGKREARTEALGYLVGAVGTMVALGAAVLALRAGGEAVGWAFQLQNPGVVAVLLLLVAAIAFNLAGLFELPALGFATLGSEGFVGGVATGALAAFVATPCSGPFMAGALGAALILPAIAGLAIFAGLGLGLALPFLVIGFWEPARRRMPRPGAWMTVLRHVLSVPMFATALGLAWLIGQQSGVGAMTAALGGVVVLGLALWLTGARQRKMLPTWPAMPGVLAALALAVFGVGAFALAPATARASAEIVPYSASRLSGLRAGNRPVLVFATAAWCLTCKVNEATSLNAQTVRDAFRRRGAVMMEADWTRSDPEVTRLLTEHGRAGVPLYVWYPAHGSAQILPQVLTPDMVRGLVER
jgi:thiol:disulfide interchange protein/DsbC/DsbD-like thiol-disulfide interchange protein